MAKTSKLKVYRTPIGFHDAYVAAPSQKAALKAWGTNKNLFARGDAEIVNDEALTAEALAQPGKVIRRARGTSAEHMASLPKVEPRDSSKPKDRKAATDAKAAQRPASKPKPQPSRSSLDQAEAGIAEMRSAHDGQTAALDRQLAKLTELRKKLRDDHARVITKMERDRQKAKAVYDAAIRKWRAE